MARRADTIAQLANPVACRLRNAVVRRLPERAQRHEFRMLMTETAGPARVDDRLT